MNDTAHSTALRDMVDRIASAISDPQDNYCRECECECDAPRDDDGTPVCDGCGGELGPIDSYSYLTDALDIEHTISGTGEYLGSRVLVTFGGPNIWVDTRHNRVEGYWWSDTAFCGFTDSIGLGDACRELWECV